MRFAQLYNLIESFLKSLPKTKNIFDYNAYLYFHDRCIGSHIIFNICIAYTWNFFMTFLLFFTWIDYKTGLLRQYTVCIIVYVYMNFLRDRQT